MASKKSWERLLRNNVCWAWRDWPVHKPCRAPPASRAVRRPSGGAQRRPDHPRALRTWRSWHGVRFSPASAGGLGATRGGLELAAFISRGGGRATSKAPAQSSARRFRQTCRAACADRRRRGMAASAKAGVEGGISCGPMYRNGPASAAPAVSSNSASGYHRWAGASAFEHARRTAPSRMPYRPGAPAARSQLRRRPRRCRKLGRMLPMLAPPKNNSRPAGASGDGGVAAIYGEGGGAHHHAAGEADAFGACSRSATGASAAVHLGEHLSPKSRVARAAFDGEYDDLPRADSAWRCRLKLVGIRGDVLVSGGQVRRRDDVMGVVADALSAEMACAYGGEVEEASAIAPRRRRAMHRPFPGCGGFSPISHDA